MLVNGEQVYRRIYSSHLQLAAEVKADGTVSEFVFGTSVNSADYMKQGSSHYRMIHDHLGSPRLVVNSLDGTIMQRLDYNEWGNVIADTNPSFQPFGFAGGLYDADTKLVKFGARDYSASVARWNSKDPILFAGGDTNLYRYVISDPVNYFDPEGKAYQFIVAIAGAISGAIVSGVTSSIINDDLTGKDFAIQVTIDALKGAAIGGISGFLLATSTVYAVAFQAILTPYYYDQLSGALNERRKRDDIRKFYGSNSCPARH